MPRVGECGIYEQECRDGTCSHRKGKVMPELDQNQLSQRRIATIMHPFTGIIKEYRGDEVTSITDKGLVISVSRSRIFYPWHRVTSFIYDTGDVVARKAIQGW